MSFEQFPNEILLDLFEYFNGVELLQIFYGLNSRLNLILYHRFPICSFKFDYLSKRDFDTICLNYLPIMIDYITILHLYDNEQTPREIQIFFSFMPSFHKFSQLKSLSLSNLRSYDILKTILHGCHYLHNLTHLNLLNCYIHDDQIDFQLLINNIWSLSKLIHCTIDISIKDQCSFSLPTIISLTLKYLSIEKIQIKLHEINQLYEYTPNLEYLSISISSFIDNNYNPIPLLSLTNLNINTLFKCNVLNIDNLLENTPNIRYLNINLSSDIINGYQWEHIIKTCLPYLKIFQLKMKITLNIRQNLDNKIEEIINSFQTSFWIDEHKWFIHCITSYRDIYVYTLPNNYQENFPIIFKSTNPRDDQCYFYNNLTKIIIPTFFDQPLSFPSYVRMTNIQELYINLPINTQFWHIVPHLKKLNILKIYFHTNSFQSQVQSLLNRSFYLKKLIIHQYETIPLQTSLFKYTHRNIRELHIIEINHYFNQDECIKLSQSSLGKQCQQLSILLHNRKCVLSIVIHMNKLHALNIRCNDDCEQYNEHDNDDKYIQWLKHHLPSRSVVIRNPKSTRNILIWI